MKPSPGALPLPEYRALLQLDEPFTPAGPLPAASRAGAVARLLSELRADGTERQLLEVGLTPGTDPRAWLRALLTVRGPTPLPPAFHALLDRLWQAEQRERSLVDAAGLPRLGPPGSIASRCALWQGDITRLRADAIVNAANAALLGCFQPFHACIDNAIHAAAGPRLREDCARLVQAQGFAEPTGHAKATRGYHLPARFVLHTVGPVASGPLDAGYEQALASCYRACLDTAAELAGVRTVAFCAISTGVFGFPRAPAARIALETVGAWLRAHPGALDLVVFDLFSDADRATYAEAVAAGHLAAGER
jgi:O-acetyl-ADP-ribose deacetylase (regulator of RNase III)